MNDLSLEPKTYDAIRSLMPSLAALRHQIKMGNYFEPSGVVLPRSLDPGPHEGDDATDTPAMFMGLRVTWGDRPGLIYSPPA